MLSSDCSWRGLCAMHRELLQRAHKWLTDLMVNGEYGRRECCWTDPDYGGHREGCELEALMKDLKRAADEVDADPAVRESEGVWLGKTPQ